MTYYLVGCGGIGGWLGLSLAKMLAVEDELVLIDGDDFEEKNLDRQMCSKRDLGRNKAKVLRTALRVGARCALHAVPKYLGEDSKFAFSDNSVVLTGVDNHPARLRVLSLCDQASVPCVHAANGYEDAEAFYYMSPWSGSALDPRNYYPELLEDVQDDPLAPPCTGEILESRPQLAMANMAAAAMAMKLLWFWQTVAPKLTEESSKEMAPVQIIGTAAKSFTRTVKEIRDEAAAAKEQAA